MSGLSERFLQLISEASRPAISSRGSGGGRWRSGSRDGRMTSKSGLAPAPASLSPVQASGAAQATNGTCGRSSIGSSASALLQSCLESRLRQRMDVNGSLEYELTWKRWDMESGPPICALRARARRTSGRGYGGWPSPNLYDAAGGGSITAAERRAAGMKRPSGASYGGQLRHLVLMAGWVS